MAIFHSKLLVITRGYPPFHQMIIPWSTGALEHHANGVQGLVHGSGRLCEILGMTGKSNRKGKHDGDVGGISAAKISKTGDSM